MAESQQRDLQPVTSRPVAIEGPAGMLEALLDATAGAATAVDAVAVVCHPHPLHQGTMHNKVVHTLSRAFARRGAIAVRFNFRGVGESAGSFDDGTGETDDALAVIEWIGDRHPDALLYLGGFSFGGMIAIRAACKRDAAALITVAPAIRFLGAEFERPACPWLVIQGEADEIVSAADVVSWAQRLDPPPALETISGIGHFFHGALDTIGDAADSFLGQLGPGHTLPVVRGETRC
jgi:hypothetical protein